MINNLIIQKMIKNFDLWNDSKKFINYKNIHKLYSVREIWWCQLGVNIGYEQDGTGNGHERPVVILKGFSKYVCIVIPLTTSTKRNLYHISVGEVDNKKAFAIISQIRLIDTKRLINKLGTLEESLFEFMRKAVKDIL